MNSSNQELDDGRWTMDDVAEQGAVAVIKQAAKDGRPGDEVGLGFLWVSGAFAHPTPAEGHKWPCMIFT